MSQSWTHQSATCQKGVTSCQKGVLPNLSRDGGVHPRASPKRGTCSHPIFDHSRSPAIHSRKRTSGWLGGAQGARHTQQIFSWNRFDGEHRRRRRRKALYLFWLRFFGGCTPFCQILSIIPHSDPQQDRSSSCGLLPVTRLLDHVSSNIS